MKLLRFGLPGQEKPGILDASGNIRDLSLLFRDLCSEQLTPSNMERIKNLDLKQLPIVEAGIRIGPCIGNPKNLICVGLNYLEHSSEMNLSVPVEPIIFNKVTSAISGPYDP